jgi:hypothetical protein
LCQSNAPHVRHALVTRGLGDPEHFDVYLTEDERAANDQFLPCCPRSKSVPLVLGL